MALLCLCQTSTLQPSWRCVGGLWGKAIVCVCRVGCTAYSFVSTLSCRPFRLLLHRRTSRRPLAPPQRLRPTCLPCRSRAQWRAAPFRQAGSCRLHQQLGPWAPRSRRWGSWRWGAGWSGTGATKVRSRPPKPACACRSKAAGWQAVHCPPCSRRPVARRAPVPAQFPMQTPRPAGGWWGATITAYDAQTGEHELTYKAGRAGEMSVWTALGQLGSDELRCGPRTRLCLLVCWEQRLSPDAGQLFAVGRLPTRNILLLTWPAGISRWRQSRCSSALQTWRRPRRQRRLPLLRQATVEQVRVPSIP